ncbi:hypothetical protein M0R45_032366 [Rubus argutus]|uniref:Uncharacterized protein n=1 Tax=Rubus argutus TaxID=59490 RepID=A0AAW1WJ57_RUBAR
MAIAPGILFPLIVFLYSLFLYLIPMLLLCISALFANLIQALCFVCIWPISKNTYRKIKRVVKELDWLVLVFLIDWWARIKSDLQRLKGFPQPSWLSFCQERTGFVPGELLAAQRLPVPSNVSSPRTKDALLDKPIAEQTFGDIELQAIGRPLKSFLVVISWACLFVFGTLKLNFIDWSTLVVLSAALLSGRMLAPLGRRVLSEMQRSIEASLRNISWSEHVVPILIGRFNRSSSRLG